MTPFKQAYVPQSEIERAVKDLMLLYTNTALDQRKGFFECLSLPPTATEKDVEAAAREYVEADQKRGAIFKNDTYQVKVYTDGITLHASDGKHEGLTISEVCHLSIKRIDRQPIHDWRELQAIKNELCGEDCEGIELYPAESRKVDTANQYHMWVLEPGHRFPIGFGTRLVTGPVEGTKSQQREFAKP